MRIHIRKIVFLKRIYYNREYSYYILFHKGLCVISASDFRKGTKFLYNDAPHIVVDFQKVKPGKGGAFVRTKMKNLISGSTFEETFRSEQKFPEPDLERKEMQYLYQDGDMYNFMDQDSFEQIELNRDAIEMVLDFLKEQTVYDVLFFQGKPIALTPPLFMELAIAETQPGVRGDTAKGGATKPATLETGLVLQVPLFINEGDVIKVDTRDSSYIERVKL
jgi:elongation factor P